MAAATICAAQRAVNGTVPLVAIGKNQQACSGPNGGSYIGPNQGVATVHYNATQKRFSVHVSVHNAQPDTSYRVDIHCWIFGPQNAIGVLTANYQGTGTAQIDVYMETVPTQPFFY